MAKFPRHSTFKGKVKPVSCPIAPIGTLCRADESLNSEITSLLRVLEVMKSKERLLYNLCMFLLYSGCRVSEALSICYDDIDRLGRVRIRASKRSYDRLVSIAELRDFLLYHRSVRSVRIFEYNRFYVYRRFKFWGLGRVFGGNKVQSVTHYFRHISVLLAASSGFDDMLLRQITGHKSKDSINFYKKS